MCVTAPAGGFGTLRVHVPNRVCRGGGGRRGGCRVAVASAARQQVPLVVLVLGLEWGFLLEWACVSTETPGVPARLSTSAAIPQPFCTSRGGRRVLDACSCSAAAAAAAAVVQLTQEGACSRGGGRAGPWGMLSTWCRGALLLPPAGCVCMCWQAHPQARHQPQCIPPLLPPPFTCMYPPLRAGAAE
jgi:hypothetical protein